VSDACCTTCTPAAGPPAAAPDEAVRAASARRRQSFLALSGLAIAIGATADWLAWPVPSTGFFAAAIVLAAETPARGAWRAIRARALDIDVLMLIAVCGAVALGEWFEAATVVWLFGIAHWLEARSMDRARHAIRSLMTLAPATAVLKRHGLEMEVPASAVVVGDMIVVRPGDRVPVDGVVVAGESAMDQSPVTGESWPVEKASGDAVFAGTINGTGALEIAASRPASDSTIARIIHLVQDAQQRRAPVQTFVDRFARRYTPAVVALAAVIAVVPPFFAGGLSGWSAAAPDWIYRALTLLVVACPCALVISTPVSFVSALTAAARHGVLVKGGAALERLAGVRVVAFDKTGTLTHARISVTDVHGVDGRSQDNVLSVAAALESRSEHPIGRAIVSHAREAGLAIASGSAFRALPGLGAEATVAAATAVIGSHRLFEERQLCTPSLHARVEEVQNRGGTAVLVSHGGAPLGVIGLADHLRANGQDAVAGLRAEGVERIVLLTGDTGAAAAAVRARTGVDEVQADLLPAAKVEAVESLRRQYGPVAMVGDGINDAPALAAADVGIAMGAAGSDVALETADVALMSDQIERVPFAIRLARATLANIRVNIGIALGLKLAFVVLAAAGVATLWMAILADTGASLLVTANSLRLLAAGRAVTP
jgi:Cd2+/Zn2+-exporting ATPase